MTHVHNLSGPIRILDEDGTPGKPGDLLAVEMCNLGPLPGDEWGYTAMFDREKWEWFLDVSFSLRIKGYGTLKGYMHIHLKS